MANKKHLFLSFCLLISGLISAQGVTGKWVTIDDETGDKKSMVEIFKKGDKLYGKILELYRKPHENQDPVCKDCEDDRKDKRIIGMEIIRDMEYDDGEWDEGTICDPKNGKVYDCKLWVDEDNPDQLNVRGYIGFLFRTQYWKRVK